MQIWIKDVVVVLQLGTKPVPSIKILKSHFLNKQNPKHPKLIFPQSPDIRKVRQPAEKR